MYSTLLTKIEIFHLQIYKKSNSKKGYRSYTFRRVTPYIILRENDMKLMQV